MDIVGEDIYSYYGINGLHQGAVDLPNDSVGLNHHFVVYTFKDYRGDKNECKKSS
jgi:hypothetical protein